jgi:hypothetical protein
MGDIGRVQCSRFKDGHLEAQNALPLEKERIGVRMNFQHGCHAGARE